MVEIKEIGEVSTEETSPGAHSHITGLGLDENLKAKPVGDGLVGQEEAREAAGIVVEMVKKGRRAGHGLLLIGPPGTGKTAIAYGIARELGEDVPFVSISGSEIYGTNLSKTEFLQQGIRRAIGVEFTETREVIEGKVESLEIERAKHPLSPYMEVPSGAIIELKTQDDHRRFKVPEEIAIQLVQAGVREGDVIQIDVESGHVTKLGRAKDALEEEEEELLGVHAVELPEGPVQKKKEIKRVVTLHDLDMANVRAGRLLGFREEEITDEIRQKVDERVQKMVDEGEASLVPGVLFIDEAHMLDIEAFAFLNRSLEEEIAPILVMATNRAMAKVRGTDEEAPHGIPGDLLDRMLIARTRPFERHEIYEIIGIRARVQDIQLTDEAHEYLTDLGEEKSIRYATRLLEPARIVAEKEGSEVVEKKHVERVEEVFTDVSDSVEYMERMRRELPVMKYLTG
ncbi:MULTISPECIES: RuvB-like helicase [unclassified Methanopyrus]|uniref:RuvB-like helicase n=1 Tax=unclassified Methanopyrus TaxID=2684913 RepID=UPI000B4C0F6F|nr:RuvB-like helicase [Methanopyrus sp. KOL6]